MRTLIYICTLSYICIILCIHITESGFVGVLSFSRCLHDRRAGGGIGSWRNGGDDGLGRASVERRGPYREHRARPVRSIMVRTVGAPTA